jgi:hypothetical protein
VRGYRLVFLDREGRAQAYYSVYCGTDAEASRQAKATGYQNEIEVWDGDRIVRRLNCRELQPVEPPKRRSHAA